MEQKKIFEALNQESLDKIEEYLKTKGTLKKEHHDKINEAKAKWQDSWNDFMDVLVYLERLEI